jgi:HAD superfamily hydrolase (TIGR01509 family)
MRHYFSKKVRIVLILAVVVAVLLTVASNLTGLSLPDLVVKGIMTPIRSGASALTEQAEQLYSYVFRYETLAAENELLRQELAQMKEDNRRADALALENSQLRALLELKAAGHSLNVLTASPHDYLDPCLRRHGIYDLFDNVWTIDDFGYTKAQTIIYTTAAQRLGATVDRCIFVDDNATAVVTARQAGMQTIGIFDETSGDFAPQLKAAAHLYIEEFSQISCP